jgi:hypothetical protein
MVPLFPNVFLILTDAGTLYIGNPEWFCVFLDVGIVNIVT